MNSRSGMPGPEPDPDVSPEPVPDNDNDFDPVVVRPPGDPVDPVPRGWRTAGISETFYPILASLGLQVFFPSGAPAPGWPAPWSVTTVGLVGRDVELAELATLLDPGNTAGPGIVPIAGIGGVGKTVLAVEAGRAALRHGWFGKAVFLSFAGRGGIRGAVSPGEVLDAMLWALGVPGEHIPAGAEERAVLYRSVLARTDDPVLVIADDVSSEAQVRSLLPGEGRHKLLVTSRDILAGLDARPVDVTVLDRNASIALLDAALRADRPGDDRISGELDAARRLAETCGGLPLALQITAAMLKASPDLGARSLAKELSAGHQRLRQPGHDHRGEALALPVTVACDVSYRKLAEGSARVFRLLCAIPGPDVSTAAVAVLAEMPVASAQMALEGLFGAHLVEAVGAIGRWRVHHMLRLYAERLSDEHADTDERERALDRLLGHYLATTEAAGDRLRLRQDSATSGQFASAADALAWLDAEYAVILAAVGMAANTGRDQIARRLPLALAEYFMRRQLFDDWLTSVTISIDAARRLSDRHGEGVALDSLSSALVAVHRFEEAVIACRDAAVIFGETRDRHGQGASLTGLAGVLRAIGSFDEAIKAAGDAVAVLRDAGDRHGEGVALDGLGLALVAVHRFEEAVTAHKEAAVIFGEAGDQLREAMALENLEAASDAQQAWD